MRQVTKSNWREVPIYENTDINAGKRLLGEMEDLKKREDVLRLKREFVRRHYLTLAGLNWDIGYLDPEIELCWWMYRGERSTPGDIARLWPDADWKRKVDKWRKDEVNWVAEVDGVTLIIKGAESLKPVRPKVKKGKIDLSLEGGEV